MADLGMLQALEKPPAATEGAAPVGLLGSVIKGKVFAPPRVLVYGIDGIGKSTFATQAPKAIFIQTAKDLEQLGPARLPVCNSYAEVIAQLTAVATEPHDYQTVVLDHITRLEELIWAKLANQAGKRTVQEIGGGFRRGEKSALVEWQEVITLLERCVSRGMAVILTAHQGKEDAGNPEYPMLKVIGPSIDKDASALIRKWVDATLFLTRRMVVNTVGQGIMEKPIAKPVGSDGGERIMICTGSPMLHAKNRYDIPNEIPFPPKGSWDLFMQYVSAFYAK